MITLPPPRQPNSPLPSTPVPGSSGRLRTGVVALVASTLAIGGLVVGSQFVSATAPSLTETVDQPDDTEPPEETPPEDSDADDVAASTIEFENCFFGSGAVDAGSFDLDGAECTSMIPEDLQDEFAAWDDYDKCLDEQLGFDEGLDLPKVGSVTVDIPSEDGFDFSLFNFGEDDGSVTIVKDGDNISVTTDGDVTELDDFSFGDLDPEFDAAHDACADLLPDGIDLLEFMHGPGEFETSAEVLDD